MFDNIKQHKKIAFLLAYVQKGELLQAAELSGVQIEEHLTWVNESSGDFDAEYLAAFEMAQETYMKNLKKEASLFSALKDRKKRLFLAAYAETGNVTRAAQISKVSRTMHYHWTNPDYDLYDSEYVKAFALAEELATDRLEEEARRRAYEGIREPVFYKGQVAGHKIVYSDNLLMFLLKGKRERYKEGAEINNNFNPDGGELRVVFGRTNENGEVKEVVAEVEDFVIDLPENDDDEEDE